MELLRARLLVQLGQLPVRMAEASEAAERVLVDLVKISMDLEQAQWMIWI